MNGVELIAAERQRQIDKEDWTPEHDDLHFDDELATAAVCYALTPDRRKIKVWNRSLIQMLWPWDQQWWKPNCTRIRQLVKAGALIAAEIDRLQRLGESDL